MGNAGKMIADDVHPFADLGAGVVDVEGVQMNVHQFGPLRVDARPVLGFNQSLPEAAFSPPDRQTTR